MYAPAETYDGGLNELCAALPVGSLAPEFRLHSSPHETCALSSYRGWPIVLAFYRADWSPSCTDQIETLQYFLSDIRKAGAKNLIGISVDGVWCHHAFATDRSIEFPLLSDFEPRGKVATSYGVFDPSSGHARRAVFVIDRFGRIRWSKCYPSSLNPGVAGILDALNALP